MGIFCVAGKGKVYYKFKYFIFKFKIHHLILILIPYNDQYLLNIIYFLKLLETNFCYNC